MAWTFVKVAGPNGSEANGPIWDGEAILFSLPSENRILRYHPGTGRVAEFRNYTVGARGLALGTDRRVYACQSSGRRVVRFDVDGSASMLAVRLDDGQLHNNPYDLAFDSVGRIWFTDPEPPPPGRTFEPAMNYAAVLRLERDGHGLWKLRRMTYDTSFPTGILLSRDERILYVADSVNATAKDATLRAYPVLPNGDLGTASVLHAFGPGTEILGLCQGANGNIISCVAGDGHETRPGLSVFRDTDGTEIAKHFVAGSSPTNCVVVERMRRRDLYVTTSDGSLYCAEGINDEH